MNDSLGFRFERNQYFTGKLLTAQDFKIEQKYLNDKRRILNRMMFGYGIVCGLQVIHINDKIISVEAGMAIDSTGQEIIVDTAVTQNLSKIIGFPDEEYTGNLYLCIKYDEKEKDPAYSVESSNRGNEYNRVQEGYQLFIKKSPPDFTDFGLKSMIENTRLIYENKQIRIWNTMPKFVNPNEVFEAVLKIEKLTHTQKLKVSFKIESEQFMPAVENFGGIVFEEPESADETEYEHKYLLKSGDILDVTGKIAIKDGKVNIQVGDKNYDVKSDYSSKTKIVAGPIKQKILESYLERPLDLHINDEQEQCIYIAKISVLQVKTEFGATYSIDKVEKVSFGQYIYNTTLMNAVSDTRETEKKVPDAVIQNKETADMKEIPETNHAEKNVATGYVDILISDSGKSGNRYFSCELEHGLGTGQVLITTGIENLTNSMLEDLAQSKGIVYFGDYDIFNNSPYSPAIPAAATGAMVYPQKGTFRVGVSLTGQAKVPRVRIRWWAYKDREQAEEPGNKIEIRLDPDFAEVKTGETYRLKAVVKGTENTGLTWNVNETNGGTVTGEGVYTAPENKGVYSVTATSCEDPFRKETVYIIVK
jgi:hypothetical protein